MAGIRTVLIIDSNKEDRAKAAVFLEEYYNVIPHCMSGVISRITAATLPALESSILYASPMLADSITL